MEDNLCLLGFGANVTSLIFNTLNQLNYRQTVHIVENQPNDEKISFENGIQYKRFKENQYSFDLTSRYLFGVMDPKIKMLLFEYFLHNYQIKKEQYGSLFHPTLVTANTAKIANGIYIEPGCILSPFSILEFGCSINRASSIGHHTKIGEFATVGPGATIAGHCDIGKGASLGIGSVIFDKISIGKGSIIGGGSVVTRNIPENVIAFGNPCKVIKPIIS